MKGEKLNEELGPAFRRVMTERRMATNDYLEGCILLLSVQCLINLRIDRGALRRWD
jgi:hypothetical protein